ncbi:MAG: 3-oxoacyl-[acyl-carrier-protein] reductase [Anaerolineae bacterium]|nr:3-oxoacyl-[acyl-carrier-protein] reductase [Anaerolineae bacterium]MCB9104149.1 3-oxoacyl-[acyl-carrier-protein] reductase [Anaerolineales bacterium]
MFNITNKVAVVTGSSRGIGAGIAQLLAAQGAKVVVNHRNSSDGAEAVVAAIKDKGGEAVAIQADVSDGSQAEALIKSTIDTFGQIDILVNNAGTTRDKLIMKMKDEDWDVVLSSNLSSVYNCSKAVVRPMMKKRSGRIINITSVVGLTGQAGQTNYAASKAGIIGFTKSLAKEVGSRNITVNAIAPGFIPTALTDVLPEQQIQAIIETTPVGRLGTVEEVAAAVLFLASDEAAFITGQVLSVDGGLVMQ